MSHHLLKLDEILAELVETSAIDGHRKLLENFRTIMREPENPVITLEELFKRYCRHVEEDVNTSELEVDTDDEPTYEYVTALADIVPDDRPWHFDSSYKTAMLYLHIEDSEDLHYATTDYEEMVDALFAEENISAPEFPEGGVYGCYETKLGLAPEQVEALMEESEYAYEDFELSDAARCDIKAFCESFNEKYAETVYFPNWSVGVVKD